MTYVFFLSFSRYSEIFFDKVTYSHKKASPQPMYHSNPIMYEVQRTNRCPEHKSNSNTKMEMGGIIFLQDLETREITEYV